MEPTMPTSLDKAIAHRLLLAALKPDEEMAADAWRECMSDPWRSARVIAVLLSELAPLVASQSPGYRAEAVRLTQMRVTRFTLEAEHEAGVVARGS